MIFFLSTPRPSRAPTRRLWGGTPWLTALLLLCAACSDSRIEPTAEGAPSDDPPSLEAPETSAAADAAAHDERPAPSAAPGDAIDSPELEVILGLREAPPFRIDDLLTQADLRENFTLHAPTTRTTLEGSEKSPYYNDLRFHTPDSEGLGVVLQYWHFRNNVAASTHFEMLRRGSATDAKPVGVASDAFYDEVGNVTRLVSVAHDLNGVVALSCDLSNCHVPQLIRLTEMIIQRMHE